MAVIDSNNFIIHLVWSGLVDKATCGELREAIELCTIKDVYTKSDVVAMLKELQQEMEENVLADDPDTLLPFLQARDTCAAVIQLKINELEGTGKAENKEPKRVE